MNRTSYASDGEYILYPLADEDRENYTELHRQIYGDKTLLLNEAGKDIMWDSTLHQASINTYSIYEINGDYCGSVELHNYMNNTPEIGIELLENKRNQGIATKSVKMLIQKFCQERKVEYFLIRIMSDNLHSKHVFEKMGAVQIGEEESLFVSLMGIVKEHAEKDHIDGLQDIIKKYIDEDDGVRVLRYKLLPNVFD